MYQTLPCNIRLISSSPLTHPVPPCIFHILLLCESYSLLLCHTGTYVHARPRPPDYCCVFFLVGPGRLHEIAVSAFSRSQLGGANTFSFKYLPSTPRITLRDSPRSPYFSALTFPFSSIIYFTSVLYPPNFFIDSISYWSPPLPYFLDYVIPMVFQLALLLFSPIRPYQLWLATSFLACYSTLCCHFNFLTSLMVLSGYKPSSSLNTVLLIVHEHPRIFLAAVICTVSSCFTKGGGEGSSES